MKNSSSPFSASPSPHPAPHPLASASSLTPCPELDLSITVSPASKTGNTHLKPRPPKTSQTIDQSQLKSRPQGQTRRKGSTQVCFEEPVVITVTPEPHSTVSPDVPSQQAVRGQRRSRGRHHAQRHSVEPPPAASNQDPGCLERAELNTTLALKAKLQSLQGEEFNSQKAIQQTLLRSEMTKNLINTRATEGVNVARSQHLFTSLVSINMQKDQLISQAMQDRLLLPSPTHSHDSKATDGPSLLPFMTSDLFRQKPLSPEEEAADCKLRPSPCPSHSTFDLYSRQRRWEATP
uniref:Protein phosphatase 1 regulatory subunit 35 C-terminal domain-containing protein n=1 Tax=Monopterus albus TaxID=43700 RepID=A0A3Q3JH04_MONAL|nr:protein phosphatase 1 regulatory subunit 35 isoform X2 [Monopterus albus]